MNLPPIKLCKGKSIIQGISEDFKNGQNLFKKIKPQTWIADLRGAYAITNVLLAQGLWYRGNGKKINFGITFSLSFMG